MESLYDIKIIRTFEVVNEPIKKTQININKIQNIENNNKNKIINKKIIIENQINEKKNINLKISKKKIANETYSHLYDARLNRFFKKIKELKKTNLEIDYKFNLQNWYEENRHNINSLFSQLIKKYYQLGVQFNDNEQNIYDSFVEFLYHKTLY